MSHWLRRIGRRFLAVGKIEPLHPGDVVVVRAHERISPEEIEQLYRLAQEVWPENRIVVVDAATDVSIVRPARDDDREHEV